MGVEVVAASGAQGGDADVRVLVLQGTGEVGLAVGQLREQPESAGAVTGVVTLEEFHQLGFALRAGGFERGVAEVTRGQVRALQRGHGSGGRGKVELRHGVFLRAGHGHTEDATAREVAHRVAADTGVIPIGDDERAVRRDAHVGGAEPLVARAGEHRGDARGVARAGGLRGIRAHHVRPGVAVDDLIAEGRGEQVAFIDRDARGRASAGDEHRGHHAGVVEVPVVAGFFVVGDLGLLVGFLPSGAPSRAGQFIHVAVVAELHDVVDADGLVAVVVVVGLPERAEGVHGDLVVVAEVVAEDFELRAVGVAAEGHALAVGFAAVVHGIAGEVHDGVAVLVGDAFTGVAEVPVELAVGAEDERVRRVVMLRLTDLGEEQLLLVGLQVAVRVGEDEDVGRAGNDDLGGLAVEAGEHADAERGINVGALVEDGLLVSLAIAISVLEDDDAVALGAAALAAAIVHHLANPDAAQVVHLDVRGAEEQRFGGEELGLKASAGVEAREGVGGVAVGRGGSDGFGVRFGFFLRRIGGKDGESGAEECGGQGELGFHTADFDGRLKGNFTVSARLTCPPSAPPSSVARAWARLWGQGLP